MNHSRRISLLFSLLGGNDRLSFANPNYVGPEKTLPPPQRPLHQLTRDESHQSFAQALNSPADSLYSDYQDFQVRMKLIVSIELQIFNSDSLTIRRV